MRCALWARLRNRDAADARSQTGGVLAVAALALLPVAACDFGRPWSQAAAFGVMLCPSTLYTLGCLLLCRPREPLIFMAVPVLWSAIGVSAAWLRGVPEDLLLAPAAVLTTARGPQRRPAGP